MGGLFIGAHAVTKKLGRIRSPLATLKKSKITLGLVSFFPVVQAGMNNLLFDDFDMFYPMCVQKGIVFNRDNFTRHVVDLINELLMRRNEETCQAKAKNKLRALMKQIYGHLFIHSSGASNIRVKIFYFLGNIAGSKKTTHSFGILDIEKDFSLFAKGDCVKRHMVSACSTSGDAVAIGRLLLQEAIVPFSKKIPGVDLREFSRGRVFISV